MDDECSFVDTGSHSEGFDEAQFGDQEREEAEDHSSFVDEDFQPADFNGNPEPSWASCEAAVSSIEDREGKMCAIGHWIENNS